MFTGERGRGSALEAKRDAGGMPDSPFSRSPWSDAFADALSLLLPVWCAGCDRPGRALCPACISGFDGPQPRLLAPGLPLWSLGRHTGSNARVIRALKEEGRTGVARPLGHLLAGALDAAGWRDAPLVPVPTSRAALRRRGYAVPELLALHTGRSVLRLLRVSGRPADQRDLGRRERERNVMGTLAVRPPRHARASAAVVLVDDVATTGATLREAHRVLAAAGVVACGAISATDTPRRYSPALPE